MEILTKNLVRLKTVSTILAYLIDPATFSSYFNIYEIVIHLITNDITIFFLLAHKIEVYLTISNVLYSINMTIYIL